MEKQQDLWPQGLQIAEWEQELNTLIYELYGRTKDEIVIA